MIPEGYPPRYDMTADNKKGNKSCLLYNEKRKKTCMCICYGMHFHGWTGQQWEDTTWDAKGFGFGCIGLWALMDGWMDGRTGIRFVRSECVSVL